MNNEEFVSRITDRVALRTLAKITSSGLRDDNLLVQHAFTIPGLSEWQANRIGISDECCKAPKGEKPWGVAIKNSQFVYVCKCNERSCGLFTECRPEEGKDVPR